MTRENTAKQGPATFVLVHGACGGGWEWAAVAERLRATGHRVFAPSLTGCGDRCHLAGPEIDLSTHIQDILNIVRYEKLENIVLCGHSYGGMVIAGVCDRIPERIASVVYLDAILPENGRSTMDYMGPERADMIRALAASGNGHSFVQPPPMLESINRTGYADDLTPHPLASFEEPLPLAGTHLRVPKKTYVFAEGWENSPMRRHFEAVVPDPDWVTVTVRCNHMVMQEMPDRTAEILEAAI